MELTTGLDVSNAAAFDLLPMEEDAFAFQTDADAEEVAICIICIAAADNWCENRFTASTGWIDCGNDEEEETPEPDRHPRDPRPFGSTPSPSK